MTIPLFTHQCGGCKSLMELHPAMRDYDACLHRTDADDVDLDAIEPPRRSSFRTWTASICVACVTVVLGSIVMF